MYDVFVFFTYCFSVKLEKPVLKIHQLVSVCIQRVLKVLKTALAV